MIPLVSQFQMSPMTQCKGPYCSAGALLVCAQWPNDESQQCDSTAQGASECANHVLVPPPACICSDVQVQPDSSAGAVFTCAQQYNTGNCGKSFLKDAIKGLPEGQPKLSICNAHTYCAVKALHRISEHKLSWDTSA